MDVDVVDDEWMTALDLFIKEEDGNFEDKNNEDGEVEITSRSECIKSEGIVSLKDDRKRRRQSGETRETLSDADVIAAAMDENLKVLNLDPKSKEGKKLRRRIRNRMSAAMHRERKKAYIDELEAIVKEKDALIKSLQSANDWMQMKLTKLGVKIPQSFSSAISDSDSHDPGTTSASTGTCSDNEDSDNDDSTDEYSDATKTATKTKIKKTSNGFGSGISLLSLVVMFGFTFYQSPQLDIYSTYTQNVALTTTNQPFPSIFHEDVDTMPKKSPGRILLSTIAPEIIKSTESDIFRKEEEEDVTLIPSLTISTPRSPLLSSIPAVSLTETIVTNVSPLHFTSKASIDNGFGLWEYHDPIMYLFPQGGVDSTSYSPKSSHPSIPKFVPKTTGFNSTNATAPQSRVYDTQKRHLRIRNSTSSAMLDSSREEKRKDENSYNEAEMQLVQVVGGNSNQQMVSTYMQGSSNVIQDRHHAFGHYGISSVSTLSQVLLTQGRALLDPGLVLSQGDAQSSVVPPVQPLRTTTTKRTSPTSDVSSSPKSHAKSSSTSKESTSESFMSAVSTWITPLKAQQHQRSSMSSVPIPVVSIGGINPGESGGQQTSGSNVLMMLLPASAVRFGKSWGDSSESTMESLLHSMNFTMHEDGSATFGSDENDFSSFSNTSTMWVEIGCSVFKAQLVKNVTLM